MAAKLGVLHVERDILRGLTAKEFRGWEMAHEVDPFTEMRQDYRIASIAQMLYNINRGEKQKALPLADFLLKWDEAQKEPVKILAPATGRTQTVEEQTNILKALAAMHSQDVPVPKVIEAVPPLVVEKSSE